MNKMLAWEWAEDNGRSWLVTPCVGGSEVKFAKERILLMCRSNN